MLRSDQEAIDRGRLANPTDNAGNALTKCPLLAQSGHLAAESRSGPTTFSRTPLLPPFLSQIADATSQAAWRYSPQYFSPRPHTLPKEFVMTICRRTRAIIFGG